jgi:heterodisulfide reductase subunit A
VGQHPFIRLMSYSEVENVSGYVGNFKVRIKKKARYVDESKCTGCNRCQELCPTRVSSEFEQGLAKRKAIYIPFPQAVPNKATIDAENCRHLKGLAEGKDVCRLCETGIEKKNIPGCEAGAIDFGQKEETVEVDVGSIIVATGFQQFDPSAVYQYGYGRYDNVLTGLQFERMSNASGPTGGEILMADGRRPESIAILHCVGSRDENYHKYCSRVCCMYSLKYSHLLREKLPESSVYQLYIDMRCAGSGYEEFYERLQREGVNFVRGRAGEITNLAESAEEQGKLMVICEDTLVRRKRRLPVDMVILSCALEPPADADLIARTFSLSRKADGFFLEKHPKLDPVATMTDGLFVVGCCQSPKDIPDTVAQASAAAARALAMISKGKVEIEAAIAVIDEEQCAGCKICIDLCPYKAISFDEEKKVSCVNEAVCKGCGVCVAACPSSAITGRHFTNEQIMAEIEGVLV